MRLFYKYNNSRFDYLAKAHVLSDLKNCDVSLISFFNEFHQKKPFVHVLSLHLNISRFDNWPEGQRMAHQSSNVICMILWNWLLNCLLWKWHESIFSYWNEHRQTLRIFYRSYAKQLFFPCSDRNPAFIQNRSKLDIDPLKIGSNFIPVCIRTKLKMTSNHLAFNMCTESVI